MAESPLQNKDVSKEKLSRCVDWLEKQNSQEKRKSLRNKNDIQFIIQNNADRKKFLLSAAEDEATVPPGVGEDQAEPQVVSLRKLRHANLRLCCEWHSCQGRSSNYEQFQKHVASHLSDLHVIDTEGTTEYVCLWDVCGHKTSDFAEMTRHVNFHAYHAKLLAIGYNGRATLKLVRCKKDSSARNQLPPLTSEHHCMWTGCDNVKFNSFQTFLDHVKMHVKYSDKNLCSWAGCGLVFPKHYILTMHVRSHTAEKLIACYHCGRHFACNRKLADHLRRQNVCSSTGHGCAVCGARLATEYLARQHARQHVCVHACSLCDMTAPSLAALAQHVRYRHLPPGPGRRPHACPHCEYRSITKNDMKKHLTIHNKKKKNSSDASQDENSDAEQDRKKKKVVKKYACHMCPEKRPKIFCRGNGLTTHLLKVHGAQWPCGHSRFRYQISEDGMYRLTTTRYESLEVSTKIVDGYNGERKSLSNAYEFNLELKSEPTEDTPRRFEITLKNSTEKEEKEVEITMCDVDEEGNIISTETITSDVIRT